MARYKNTLYYAESTTDIGIYSVIFNLCNESTG